MPESIRSPTALTPARRSLAAPWPGPIEQRHQHLDPAAASCAGQYGGDAFEDALGELNLVAANDVLVEVAARLGRLDGLDHGIGGAP
jgi:hypothetical protein